MARFPGLVRGAGSPAGSSGVRDASWFAWSRGRWKTKAMFYGPFRARPVIHAEIQAHPEGFRGAEESFQRRVQVPTISRSAWRPFCRMQIAWLTELA
jgi:hypothetical protein